MASANTALPIPEPFFEVRVHEFESTPGLSGLCVGYEREQWRASPLADYLMEWLPEFSLNWSELQSFSHANAVQLLRKAATVVYKTEKFQRRGEFGELLLHVAIRQVFNSVPAISKIYYKSAVNDTVKGFDAVHVVGPPDDMSLWLGEAKFYSDIDSAISAVASELRDHTEADYLRTEFALILNKVDIESEHAKPLKRLLSPNTSLDAVFTSLCLPVLLTYNSECLASHASCSEEYVAAFKKEIKSYYTKFKNAGLAPNLSIHLFLVPLHTKELLVEALDTRLRTWQNI